MNIPSPAKIGDIVFGIGVFGVIQLCQKTVEQLTSAHGHFWFRRSGEIDENDLSH